MNEELNRVKQDMEVINAAVGFGQPPLGREDVWALNLLGVLGLVWAVGVGLIGDPGPESITILGLLVSLVSVVAYHFKYTRGGGRTVARDRAYRYSWSLATVLGILIGGFYVWAKFFAELKGPAFLGAALLLSGALLVVLAVTDRWRSCFWGWAIPCLLFGGFAPFIPQTFLATLTGVLVCVGGFASGGLLHFQLKACSLNGKAAH